MKIYDKRGAIIFTGVDLRGANLWDADLRNSDLRESDLRGAYLRGANLLGADPSGANTEGAILPTFCKWPLYAKDDVIYIACESKTIHEWDAWFAGDEEYETPRDSEEFKRIYANYLAVKAYVQAMQ